MLQDFCVLDKVQSKTIFIDNRKNKAICFIKLVNYSVTCLKHQVVRQ
jgi:hypothetical protein